MTNRSTIPELDRKGLRDFGLLMGGVVAALFGLLFPWILQRAVPLWPFLLGGVLAVWGLVAAQSLRPVYRGWMRFGLLLNRIVTPVVLGIVFFALITPMAKVMRLCGRDALSRRFDPRVESYRVPSRSLSREDMEKPY